MNKVLKIAVIIYFAFVFPILFFIADFFVLESDPKIYALIPQDADIVIEINTKNFIQEIAYQRIFNESYFKQKLPKDDETSLLKKGEINVGIDFYSQIIFFREHWAEKNIWYAILSVSNKSNFESFMVDKGYYFNIEYADNYAVILLNHSHENKVLEHQKNIAGFTVKSFDSKVDLSEIFSTENELNIYINPKNSQHIIDGYLHFNFEKDRVITKGSFTPIGKIEDIPFIKYQPSNDKAVTLRSSLNLFNSVYLFNKNFSLKDLPNYTQLCLDFNGTTFKTLHADIPIIAYPELNVQFDIIDSLIWDTYLTNLNDTATYTTGTIFINKPEQKLIINAESKSIFNYSLNNNYFKLYQTADTFTVKELNDTYFYVNIYPNSIFENTTFVQDTLNPAQLIDKIKIGIIESILKDMNFLNDIDHIKFTINHQNNSTDFLSNGEVIYIDKNGHSIIESIVVVQKFLNSVGAILD